ncbi:MAG: stalk domain-containing protein [Bacillota bacterium]|nr:stalk domain-containing protein [Bacillota bacterium]
MKKGLLGLLLGVVLLLQSAVFADANDKKVKLEDGIYEVPVQLKHFYEDKASMGNAALRETAKVEVKDGKATYTLDTKEMEFTGLKGVVEKIYVFKDKADGEKVEAKMEKSMVEGYKDAFVFERAVAGEDMINLAVTVDVMKKMTHKDAEKVVLKLDWAKAKKMEMTDKKDEKMDDKKEEPKEMPKGNPAIIDIMVNGKMVETDVEPYIAEGRTMVPARFISEALGLKVEWDEATKTVSVGEGDAIVKLVIDSKKVTKADGTVVEIDVPAVIKDGRTMVPVRAISELFGAKVDWNNETRTVIIEK